ncbi:hypothetical protein SAMN04487950_4345 [Halogranum rubrum]|uniref:Uncharacterized protein n=1 Tax=Halogranum rubrum TaxID=553466 RepID=A0A1I4J371_9EURY|nr:hypothetical protein [Halogranum rubrum]SFL60591.1 hypothetical protein SAMN04487950_4345 [Halogranum rubrum]
MITNRDIQTVDLFDQALGEVIESAQDSGVPDAALAEALRSHADELE